LELFYLSPLSPELFLLPAELFILFSKSIALAVALRADQSACEGSGPSTYSYSAARMATLITHDRP
jgi:hypothetical protein